MDYLIYRIPQIQSSGYLRIPRFTVQLPALSCPSSGRAQPQLQQGPTEAEAVEEAAPETAAPPASGFRVRLRAPKPVKTSVAPSEAD